MKYRKIVHFREPFNGFEDFLRHLTHEMSQLFYIREGKTWVEYVNPNGAWGEPISLYEPQTNIEYARYPLYAYPRIHIIFDSPPSEPERVAKTLRGIISQFPNILYMKHGQALEFSRRRGGIRLYLSDPNWKEIYDELIKHESSLGYRVEVDAYFFADTETHEKIRISYSMMLVMEGREKMREFLRRIFSLPEDRLYDPNPSQ